MTLASGAQLGHYQILSRLGAGGMGEVWRAHDTRLGRDVALKLLPPAFAEDPDRLARFRREARMLASLNHPNIGVIHDIVEVEGRLFLALELVEGETLAARIARGALPRDEALDIARQIAEALEEAHAKGVVHRDLKPSNVNLTPEGRVKVLDFGLAKALGGDVSVSAVQTSDDDVSRSPTLARSGTLAGVILGTAAYMSPEQASGKAVDRRADIWSFGVVVFEMLTGRAVYAGETASEILAAVIKDEPPWADLPPDCPPALVRLLKRCLRKRPRERLQDIGDARVELADVLSGVEASPEASRAGGGPRRAERWAWAIALVAALVAAFAMWRTRSLAAPVAGAFAVRFPLETPSGLVLEEFLNIPAVSPDGRSVVVGGSPAGNTRLWIRSLSALAARPLPGTERGFQPFWSPDGRSLAFFTPEGLMRLGLADGTVQVICRMESPFAGGTWGPDGTIVYSRGGRTGRLYSVPAVGGEPKPLTDFDASRQETAHAWPSFLPDGRRFLFTVLADAAHAGVYAAALDAPAERRRILPFDSRAVLAPTRHLLYVRERVLLAQAFDPRTLELQGSAVPVLQPVADFAARPGWAFFSAGGEGTLAYVTPGGNGEARLVWRDRNGNQLGTLGEPASYGQIALSPDGKLLAAEIADEKGQPDLWVLDVGRGVASRVTTDPAGEWDPVWSITGRDLVFISNRDGRKQLYRKSLDSGEPESRLRSSSVDEFPESITPDGKTLFYLSEDTRIPRFVKTLWALPLAGESQPQVVMKNGFNIDEPHLSPDGQWLLYTSDDSGAWEVYMTPYGRPGARVRVSTAGGGEPRWREDGKEVYYVARDHKLMAVSVTGKGRVAPEVGLPVALFDLGTFRPDYDDYAPRGDGQRFLVKVPLDAQSPVFQVVLSWPALIPSAASPQ